MSASVGILSSPVARADPKESDIPYPSYSILKPISKFVSGEVIF
jgi:hypothetical protein